MKLPSTPVRNALRALSGATVITATILELCTGAIVAARPLRDLPQRSVEQHRIVTEADRIIERLEAIDPATLSSNVEEDPDYDPENPPGASARQRYGDLLAASKGLTMHIVGPVASAFREDKAAVATIMGPYGSAKTTTCFQKVINSLLWQPKGSDGVRRARWCVVRDTYGHLQANVMADWFMWFPKTKENWNQTTGTHTLRFALPTGPDTVEWYELEMLFRAVDNQSAEELFKGLALTGLWLNEMDTLHQDVFKYGFPRVGRYRAPGTPLGGWSGVIGDMNAPAEDNWTYDFCENGNIGLTPEQMKLYQAQFGDNFRVAFYKQPGGLDAGAENKNNLPAGYYERIQIGMSEADKRRFIHNKFGAVRDGNPVYSQYDDNRHSVDGLKADPRFPIHLSVDGGNTPAAVFGQKVDGQVRVVDEVVIFEPGAKRVLKKLGAKEFGKSVGEYWNEHYGAFRLADKHWGDPSAWFGDSDDNAEDRAWIVRFIEGFKEVTKLKLVMKPAPVKRNLIGPRLEAVRDLLTATNDNQAAYVISKQCKVLREGYNRGYVVTRVGYSTGGGRWKDDPLKNDFSHVHDANQYLVLGLTKYDGWEDKRDGNRGAHKRRPQVSHGTGFFSQRQGAKPARRAANDDFPEHMRRAG